MRGTDSVVIQQGNNLHLFFSIGLLVTLSLSYAFIIFNLCVCLVCVDEFSLPHYLLRAQSLRTFACRLISGFFCLGWSLALLISLELAFPTSDCTHLLEHRTIRFDGSPFCF